MRNKRLQNGFGQVSYTVIRDPMITLSEKALYSYLATYADKDSNETIVSINRIASETNVSVSTVKRNLDKLCELGIISRTRRGKNETWVTRLLK